MINVVIADHQAVFRAGIAKVLAVEEDVRIVGQPLSLEQLLNGLDKLRIHVLLFSEAFLRAMPQITEVAARQNTALLALAEVGQHASGYVQAGAHGVVYRSASSAIVLDAVRRLATGERYIQSPSPHASDNDEDYVGLRVRDRLTSREMRMIAALVRGYKNREIAHLVGTSVQVVKNSLRSIYDKTGVSDRLELTLFVLHHRVLAQAISSIHFDGLDRHRRSRVRKQVQSSAAPSASESTLSQP